MPYQLTDNTLISDMISWRRDFHTHPELAFKETRTSARVAELLTEWGLAVETGIAGTGVVAVLSRGDGPMLGLRADMDALPIHETTGLEYSSQTAGCMHACGHDGHTAMLLGAAQALAKSGKFSGSVVFVFQPAEENEVGARAMVEDGLLERYPVEAIYGLHNYPGLPVGKFWIQPGAASAAFDSFDISITGKGGHAAWPHKSHDPVIAGAELVTALQTIVARNIHPHKAAVVSLTQFHSGDAYNVTPETAELKGSCRSFSPDVQALLQERLAAICNGIAAVHSVDIKLDYNVGYPPVINTKAEAALALDVAGELVGTENVITDRDPMMGSEDFAFYLEHVPGCYFMIGNGGDGSNGLHTPGYNFNDDALPIGASFWVRLVETALKSPN